MVEALKAARKEVASKEKAMATLILPTDALEQVAKLKPATREQLAQVPGFGVTRAERYGDPLLVCVRAHLEALKAAGCADGGGCGSSAPGGGSVGAGPSDSAGAAVAASNAGKAADVRSGNWVRIRYSHYCEEFALADGGKLDFRIIDAKYMLSHVFAGMFSCRLLLQAEAAGPAAAASTAILPDGGKLKIVEAASGGTGGRVVSGAFSSLRPQSEYVLQVQEDPKQAAASRRAAASKRGTAGASGSSEGFGRALGGKSKGSELVTQELKKLSAEELREGGAKYRTLLAQRDLEDMMADNAVLGEDSSGCSCMWGNPCAAPHACKDWANRFEVAKKHGWKGF